MWLWNLWLWLYMYCHIHVVCYGHGVGLMKVNNGIYEEYGFTYFYSMSKT